MPLRTETPLQKALAAIVPNKPSDLIPNFIQHLASPQHAAEEPARPPAPPKPLGPKDLVEGGQVDYYSETFRCWIPAVVISVDPETGALKIDLKPRDKLDLVEQRLKLRPRTRPQRPHLEWVRRTLREGRMEEEAQAVFRRYAGAGARRGAVPASLSPEVLGAVGSELDGLLGVSGCVVALRKAVEQLGNQRRDFGEAVEQLNDQRLSAEAFGEVFWELLWKVQRDFGQALLHEVPSSQRCNLRVQEVYRFERTLGMGTFGTVKLARSRATGAERAVKLISKSEHLWGTAEQVKVEVDHLCSLDHPHIVRLYEHFEDATHIYLVMDFCSGGELFSVVRAHRESRRMGCIPEPFIAHVMRQVMMAIAHVHARGIVHMDLKSTNIMLMPNKSTLPPGGEEQGPTQVNVNEKPHVMIIDLGVAQIFRPGNFKCNRPMGTPATMAPEVWRGEIHPKADVFSCGVVLFELLSLSFPFHCGVDPTEAIRYWASQPCIPWQQIVTPSDTGMELCRRMLALNRRDRPTALACLRLPFLQEPGLAQSSGRESNPVPERLVRQLACAAQRSVLHKSVALLLAREWPANQLPSIKRLFQKLDTARSGRLSLDRLEAGLLGLGVEAARAQEAAEAMDLSRDGTVCWSEFVAACIDLGSAACERALRRVFDGADADRDGLLSQQDLCQLLKADHLRGEQEAARDVFVELTGRADPGARIDWPTFRGHFRTEGAGVDGQEVLEWQQAEPAVSAAPGPADFFEQARGFVERAREAFWPEAQPKLAAPDEADLQQLAEMGFTDREKCAAVLRKYGNELTVLAVNDLVEAGAGEEAAGEEEKCTAVLRKYGNRLTGLAVNDLVEASAGEDAAGEEEVSF